jgi:hypothetical protein
MNVARAKALIEKLASAVEGEVALVDLQAEARAILTTPPMTPNEVMAKARVAAVVKCNAEMEVRHAQVMPTVLKLKGEGRTLREIADALNGMGFAPDRAKRYSHGVIALMLNRYWEKQRAAAK